MVSTTQASLLRLFTVLCMVVMACATLMMGFWLVLASVSLDGGSLPRADLMGRCSFIFFLISTCLYWKWPSVAFLVAWANTGAILIGVVPWVDHSLTTFFHQFVYDHIFFIAANLGFTASILLKRNRAARTT